MTVPFYVIIATEDNQIQNYDPRVINRPYHVYGFDLETTLNAKVINVEKYTGIVGQYKMLKVVDTIKDIKPPEYYLKRGELPKIQPVLAHDNVYARLSNSKKYGQLRSIKSIMTLPNISGTPTQQESIQQLAD